MTTRPKSFKQLSTQCVRIPPKRIPLLKTIGRIASDMEMPAFAVGGCVRDWMLGISETVDLDVTVDGSGIDVARAVADTLDASLDVHPHFGTATMRLPSPQVRAAVRGTDYLIPSVDFATCRRERYAKPGAYPDIALGSLQDDLYRRDFTISAMAVALSPGKFGRLVDPYHGADDLRRKRLRFLHDRSFIDDPSRILRGIRLAHRFGLRWELQTRRALLEAMENGALGLLNAGRIRKELSRIAQETNARACFRQLASLMEQSVR